MNEHELQDDLKQVILQSAEDLPEAKCIRTFEEAGLLTRDAGLVLTTDDGSEFQITIVRSR